MRFPQLFQLELQIGTGGVQDFDASMFWLKVVEIGLLNFVGSNRVEF